MWWIVGLFVVALCVGLSSGSDGEWLTWHGRATWMDWWKSKSVMKGHEMYFTVTALHFVRHTNCATWFQFEARTVNSYDHSPQFNLQWVILNFTILEIEIYNAFHEVEEDDELGAERTAAGSGVAPVGHDASAQAKS